MDESTVGLVDRGEVRDAAAAWTGRVTTATARTDRVDVDALLIRPAGCVAWALPTGQDLDTTALVRSAPGSVTRLSGALTVVSDSLATNSAADKRRTPYRGG